MHSIRYCVLAVVTFFPVLAGCGGDASATPEARGSVIAAVEPAEIVIRTRDNVFYEAPDTVAAGLTNVRLINDGPGFHHVWLVRLDDGHTVNDLVEHLKTRAPMPEWAVDVGGPNAPGVAGGETAALVTLEAGTYALLCVVDLPDGIPHVMKGMARQVTVVPSTGPAAELPAADVVMTLDDYSFATNVPITAGRRTIRFENAATQPHEAVFIRLDTGKTLEDFMQFMQQPAGAPPGVVLGGVTGIAQGRVNQITLDFEPGRYALICFVPDAGDGRPHLMHGMTQEFDVL